MDPPAFALPLEARNLVDAASNLPRASPDFLSTPQGELSFFRSIVYHRLVGPDKHFHALAVARDIQTHSGKHVELEQVWEKYREVYDEDVLETTWADQELTAIDRDGLERKDGAFNDVDPPVLDEAELETLESHSRPYTRTFPQVDFSLAPEPSLATTAFDRGRRSSRDPPVSPATDAPLKDVFYNNLEEETEGAAAGKGGESDKPEDKKRSHRKRNQTPKAAANAAAAAKVASPRRRKAKQVTEEASGSELSDLTDDDDEEEQDEDEDGGESQDETAGEDAESYLEDGTAASQNEDEEDEEREEEETESKTSRKRKVAPGRTSSTTSKRTRARSTSVATADSRTAAERKKEQATPSTRGRARAVGGSGRKPGRPTKASLCTL